MRFFPLLILCLILVASPLFRGALAQEPVVLRLEQAVDFSRPGHQARFCAHIANDAPSRTIGLMFQKHLPEQGGMFFDFQTVEIVQMWMRNTILPLDMVFIGPDARIVKIVRNTTPFSLAIISSDVPARSVLEINAGAADRHDLKIGDLVRLVDTKCTLP